MKRLPIGDLLVSMGAIDALQLQSALGHHRRWGMPLGKAILEKGFCSPDQLLQALAVQSGLASVRLQTETLNADLTELVPYRVAAQHRVVPVALSGKRQEILEVAIAAPASLAALDSVRSVSGKQRVIARIANDEDIQRALGQLYRVERPQPATDTSRVARPLSQREVEVEFTDDGARVEAQPARILIYGWPEPAARALILLLASHELLGATATAEELQRCAGHDIVIAPIPAMETLHQSGRRPSGQYLAAGKLPEVDVARAQRLGAQGFVVAPIDNELLVRSIRRLQRRAEETVQNPA